MDSPNIPNTPVPVMTKDRFSELSGLEPGVIRGMIDRGQLPTIKIGRHRLINVLALSRECDPCCLEAVSAGMNVRPG